jgi:hypothetical protein
MANRQRHRFETRGIQILTPNSRDKEFLLSDLPAITIDKTTGAAGVPGGHHRELAD